jgi:hypothetical protein
MPTSNPPSINIQDSTSSTKGYKFDVIVFQMQP